MMTDEDLDDETSDNPENINQLPLKAARANTSFKKSATSVQPMQKLKSLPNAKGSSNEQMSKTAEKLARFSTSFH